MGKREIIAQSKEAVSIFAGVAKKKEEETEVDEVKEVILREYAQSEVEATWKRYLSESNLPVGQLWTALKTAVVKYQPENHALLFSFPSETQVIYFNDVRGDIAAFFKSAQLPGLTLETYIQKDEERVVSMLTDGQKFEAWRNDNPVLEDLYKLFQLRVE